MQRILQIRSFTFFQNKDDIKYCVGQCYDGAKVMSGWASGVQARVKDQAPHATYFHCHAHRFNLVLVHSLGVVEEAKDFFLPFKQSTALYQIALHNMSYFWKLKEN